MSWKFSDEDLIRTAGCLDGPVLAELLQHMVREGKISWTGLPDLVVFDGASVRIEGAFPAFIPEDVILVEVKGPGDTLREGQRVWIDRLLALGIRVEVWEVEEAASPVENSCALSSPQALCEAIGSPAA